MSGWRRLVRRARAAARRRAASGERAAASTAQVPGAGAAAAESSPGTGLHGRGAVSEGSHRGIAEMREAQLCLQGRIPLQYWLGEVPATM